MSYQLLSCPQCIADLVHGSQGNARPDLNNNHKQLNDDIVLVRAIALLFATRGQPNHRVHCYGSGRTMQGIHNKNH